MLNNSGYINGSTRHLISHHLRRLAQAGLVRTRRDPTDQRWIYYSVDRQALGLIHGELASWFEPAQVGERQPQCGPAERQCS
jgi:hypothetical protein